MNVQNECRLAVSTKLVLREIMIKHLINIMVFGVLACDGDVKPPFIFPHGLTLNTETNILCHNEVVLFGSRGWLLEDAMSCLYTMPREQKSTIITVRQALRLQVAQHLVP